MAELADTQMTDTASHALEEATNALRVVEVDLRRAIRLGLIAGISVVFVSAIGMIEAFAERDIISRFLSMGHTLLFLIPYIFGYMAGKFPPILEGYKPAEKGGRNVLAGFYGGIAAGLVVSIFTLLSHVVELRSVFLNISPGLLELLTFNQSLGVGVLILFASMTAMGTLGGLAHLLPDRWLRALVGAVSWSLLVGLLQDVVSSFFRGIGLPFLVGVFYRGTGGLTWIGLLITFVIALGIYLLIEARSSRWRERYQALPAIRQRNVRYAGIAVLVVIIGILPQVLGPFLSEVLDLVGIFLLMGLGLNIVVGFAGLLDLGYVAFFAVGAYTTAVLISPGSPKWTPELTFWAALPFVVVAAALAGLLVGAPVIRMRGDYLAIVTLGFGEIARILFLSDWFKPALGGAQGILKIPNILIGPIELITPPDFFYPIVGFCLLAAYISWRLKDSRIGRAWMAMREDEPVAEIMGVNIVEAKLKAFVTGAILASFGGALFAVKIGSIFPHSFSLLVSITVLVLIIVGGMGSIPGVVIGAITLVGVPELLREFDEFKLLAYGVLLILMMLYRPEGLIPSQQWARELHEEEAQQDAWLRDQALAAAAHTSESQSEAQVETGD